MSDITINKSIPYVRELTNSVRCGPFRPTTDPPQVLLDIPLFMSHHRQKMIEAVCIQANKLYRLWLARNPDFEKHGRVHIIGHSVRFTSRRTLTFSLVRHSQHTSCQISLPRCRLCLSCPSK
jgi:hypothetical protein